MAGFTCTNSNIGTFNHECGKPASWAGTHANGHIQRFCDVCRERGDEAKAIVTWAPIARAKAADAVWAVLKAIRDDGRKAWLLGLGTNSFEQLTEAHAEEIGADVEQFRRDFWAQCRPERVVSVAEE